MLLESVLRGLQRSPRLFKQILVVLADILGCTLATWLAFFLRLGETTFGLEPFLKVTFCSVSLALPIFFLLGLYSQVFRFSGRQIGKKLCIGISLYALVFALLIIIGVIESTPRTVGVIQPVILLIYMCASRFAALMLFSLLDQTGANGPRRQRVLIFGTGSDVRLLSSLVSQHGGFHLVGFVSNDTSMVGQRLDGYRIYSPQESIELSANSAVEMVLLASSVAQIRDHQATLSRLSELGIALRKVPSINDITEGRVTVNEMKPLEIEDLLGRSKVDPIPELMQAKILDKRIMITGAGGSIGSELARKILASQPEVLLLVDVAEYSLYAIHADLERLAQGIGNFKTVLIPLLCSVQDRELISHVLKTYMLDSIYHSAAYKHVPLVEGNIAEGFKNNVCGTRVLVEAAVKYGIKDFVLISSDKAVRPTNFMGATKRLAEMILQGIQKDVSNKCTVFSVVRFGNVLASSGSVIPKFREQIRNGGPLTVTDPSVTRFFMTVSEAAELVLQAAALAKGGEVFVLDMGEPVNIYELAKKMIQLSGYTVRSESNPKGEIKIEITGLRPGEKMYEELLISNNPLPTQHSKIFMASEDYTTWDKLKLELDKLANFAEEMEVSKISDQVKSLVEGFEPDSVSTDYFLRPLCVKG